MKCDVCDGPTEIFSLQISLCEYHIQVFKLWVTRWKAATGYKGKLNMEPESVVNMLKNLDAIKSIKREKV